MWQFWLIACGVFLILEIFTTGFLIFWLGIASLFSMITSFFTSNIVIQLVVFVVASAILIFFTRPLLSKFLKFNDKSTMPTNVYRIIGKTGTVVTDINNLDYTGKVNVAGELWSASSETNITKGTHVKVKSVDGVKLKVEPIKEKSNVK